MPDDVVDALVRILVSAVLGGLIGVERELKGKPAGLRTNVLVAAAAAVFADVSINGFAVTQGYDPSRVAADVVSGIGFLGAGVIFASGGRPRGLTTAAALWASAALGLAVGVGRWQVGVGLVIVALAALAVLDLVERRLVPTRRHDQRDLYVVVDDAVDASAVQDHLRDHDVDIVSMAMVPLGQRIGLDLVVAGAHDDLEDGLAGLAAQPQVLYASEERGSVDPAE